MPNPCLLRDWTDSFRVNALDAHAERFFVRVMMKCDDYGRFHADVLLLKSSIFPLLPRITNSDVARWLAECEQADLLRCYVAPNGRKYLQILHFNQKRKWMKAEHPPPEGQIPLLPAETESGASRSRSRCRSRGEGHSAIAIAAPVERPGCADPSPFKEEKKPELFVKPEVKPKPREMWQLLNDEEALSKRITAEVQRPKPDLALIAKLKTVRTNLREEMKATT